MRNKECNNYFSILLYIIYNTRNKMTLLNLTRNGVLKPYNNVMKIAY